MGEQLQNAPLTRLESLVCRAEGLAVGAEALLPRKEGTDAARI